MIDDPRIHDQRSMSGSFPIRTPAEVEAFWTEWGIRHRGFVHRPDDSTHLIESKQVVRAYISDSRWVADCPSCGGGISTWPENDRGCCLDCGTVYKVKHPPAKETERALAALRERPMFHRHWRAHEGETARQLVAENKQHAAEIEAHQEARG